MIDFGVVLDLLMRSIADVQEFTSKREDAVLVAPDDGETAHGERLRGIPFGENQSTRLRVASTGIVSIVKLWNTCQTRSFGTIRLLEFLALLELRPRHDVVDDARLHELLDDGI